METQPFPFSLPFCACKYNWFGNSCSHVVTGSSHRAEEMSGSLTKYLSQHIWMCGKAWGISAQPGVAQGPRNSTVKPALLRGWTDYSCQGSVLHTGFSSCSFQNCTPKRGSLSKKSPKFKMFSQLSPSTYSLICSDFLCERMSFSFSP